MPYAAFREQLRLVLARSESAFMGRLGVTDDAAGAPEAARPAPAVRPGPKSARVERGTHGARRLP